MRSSACSKKLGTSAHQPEPSLIPGYRLVHSQLPALQMLDHHLESGKRLFKRPCLNQGADDFQRRRSFRDAIHRDIAACGELGSADSTLDSTAPSPGERRFCPRFCLVTLKTGRPSAVAAPRSRVEARLLDRVSTSPEKQRSAYRARSVGSGPPHANRGGLDIGSVLS